MTKKKGRKKEKIERERDVTSENTEAKCTIIFYDQAFKPLKTRRSPATQMGTEYNKLFQHHQATTYRQEAHWGITMGNLTPLGAFNQWNSYASPILK